MHTLITYKLQMFERVVYQAIGGGMEGGGREGGSNTQYVHMFILLVGRVGLREGVAYMAQRDL